MSLEFIVRRLWWLPLMLVLLLGPIGGSACKDASQAAIRFESPKLSAYRAGHGARLDQPLAPYVEEYLAAQGIKPQCVLEALFPNRMPEPGDMHVLISSQRYMSGNWTYFRSAGVRVFEVAQIAPASELLLVLYAELSPDKLIINQFEADWRMGLLDIRACRLLHLTGFTTRIVHRVEGLWDMITTDLRLDHEGDGTGTRIAAVVSYSHTGGGGAREQTFKAVFDLDVEARRVRLRDLRQTVDEYD